MPLAAVVRKAYLQERSLPETYFMEIAASMVMTSKS
jgi:hypothetical protein